MTKDRDKISDSGFFALNHQKELGENLSVKEKKVLEDAQSIMLHIYLQGVKSIYKMKDTSISIKASIIFEPTVYVFNGETYKYGTYPTPTQIDNFIKETKDHVLATIKKATE